MAHAHAHHHHPDVSGRVSRKLIVATVATALFVVIELAIGCAPQLHRCGRAAPRAVRRAA
jgi:Co/Zn/Cd efflux system component